MKQYTVEITNEALADMERLYNHIAYCCLLQRMQWGSIIELLMKY